MTSLYLRWYFRRSLLINQHAAPRVSSLLDLHRWLAELSAHLVIDVGVSSVVVREHVVHRYVEMGKAVGVHECYVLDAISEGTEV